MVLTYIGDNKKFEYLKGKICFKASRKENRINKSDLEKMLTNKDIMGDNVITSREAHRISYENACKILVENKQLDDKLDTVFEEDTSIENKMCTIVDDIFEQEIYINKLPLLLHIDSHDILRTNYKDRIII